MRSYIWTTAILTACAVSTSGVTPWVDALGGAFRPSDFAQDWAAAGMVITGRNPYGPDFSAEHALVLSPLADGYGYPFFPHPPFALLLSLPFGFTSFQQAAVLWWAFSIALLFILGIIIAAMVDLSDSGKASPRIALLAFGALLLWPPTLYGLEKGQFSILLAVLLGSAWLAVRQRRTWWAGMLIGLAAAVKVFPVLALGYFITRCRVAFLIGLIGVACASGLSVIMLPTFDLWSYMRISNSNLNYWETWPAVTYSINGLAARLLVPSQWSQPVIDWPIGAMLTTAVVGLAMCGSIVLASARHDAVTAAPASLFAAWCCALVALNPLAMGHTGVILAIPIVLVAVDLSGDPRRFPKLCWAAAVPLISLPRQTIFSLAPLPVDPLRSAFVVALPMWGTLLLFAIALASITTHEATIPLDDEPGRVSALPLV